MKTAHALLALTMAVACAAPFRPAEPDPLPPESPGAAPVGLRVEGVVTDRWGYVIPDAWITVRVGSPNDATTRDVDCAGASHLPTRTRTSPTGDFAVVIEAGRRAPFSACLEIEALPPAYLPMREGTIVVPTAGFTTQGATGGGEPVRVHIVLL